ncbi:protein-disulfide reductase DsbD [Vreelandella alkaliphila]
MMTLSLRSLTSLLATLAVCMTLTFSGYATSADWKSRLNSPAGNVLSPEEAFPISAWHDADQLYISLSPQDGYYLYRDHFTFSMAQSERGGESSYIQGPVGGLKNDPIFGETYVYDDDIILTAPASLLTADATFTLQYQGCAEVGVCFPMKETVIPIPYRELRPHHLRHVPVGEGHRWPLQRVDHPSLPEQAGAEKFPHAEKNASDATGPAQLAHLQELLSSSSPIVIFSILLVAGLALTFTPCVLPMLPILSAILVGKRTSISASFTVSSMYVFGMVVAYTALGVAVGLAGSGLNIHGYLQSPLVTMLFAGAFILLAFVMGGGVAMNAPGMASLKARAHNAQDKLNGMGLPGVALAGALSVVVVSPCVSVPLAGILVFISATGDAWIGGLALLGLSLGMGIPLIAIGTLGAKWLPRSGPWMEVVKKAFAFMLAAVGLWLLGRQLPGQVTVLMWGLYAMLIALTMMSAGPWRSRASLVLLSVTAPLLLGVIASDQPRIAPVALIAVSLVVLSEVAFLIYRRSISSPAPAIPLAIGALLLFGASLGATDPLRPLDPALAPESATAKTSSEHEGTIIRDTSSLDTLLASASQPVMAMFTADWCPSCKVMERRLNEPDNVAALDGVQLIYVDVTQNSDESRALLKAHGLFGPPGLVFYKDTAPLDELTLVGEAGSALIQSSIQSAFKP